MDGRVDEALVQQIFLTCQNVIMYCACGSRVTMYWRLGRNISTRSIKCKKYVVLIVGLLNIINKNYVLLRDLSLNAFKTR